jgi:XrtN system VIT domain protein
MVTDQHLQTAQTGLYVEVHTIPRSFRDRIPPNPWRAGVALTVLSMILFVIGDALKGQSDDLFGAFIFHFLIAVAYLITISVGARKRDPELRKQCRYLLNVLLLISAYALNRPFSVFDESTGWLCVALITSCVAGISIAVLDQLPGFVRQLIMTLTGIALMLWLYLAIYLIPLYPISAIALIGLGISIHSFVPAFLLFSTIRNLWTPLENQPRLWIGLGSGIGLAMLAAIAFSIQWSTVSCAAREAQLSARIGNGALPGWALIAQRLPQNAATEPFLKGNLVYTTMTSWENGWGFPDRNFGERRRHDPLVTLAMAFSEAPELAIDDRRHILDLRYDARHKTEERLWSGAHLKTGSIATRAQLWPAQRLAYQEQIVTVRNTQYAGAWRANEEALYTIQLPEGSAVTSLSLWINGREEPARLSSRGKSDSAYRTIVGYEQRDPSLVRWMEGNRVTIRVFPVPAGGERQFKIGVTTPMALHDGRLRFVPLRFEGPDATAATAITLIQVDGDASTIAGLEQFEKTASGAYEFRGTYTDRVLSMPAPPLQESRYSFNGNTYTLSDAQLQRSAFTPKRVYLDLNAAWSKAEFNEVCEALKAYPVYAGAESMRELTPGTRDEVFGVCAANRFSIFPLFQVLHPEDALIITKSTARGPNLADLDGSPFAQQLAAAVANGTQFQVFSLDDAASPYLKSLRERRILRYESGDLKQLQQDLQTGQFAGNPETRNSIVIGESALRITKTPGEGYSNGPDHLLRLYNYNDIIRRLGPTLFRSMESNGELQREADEANVVSPVSSLIVLESEADYQRFGIKGPGSDALGNAKIGNSGAVPEPHEWALILIAIATLAWLKRDLLLRRFKTGAA